MDHRSRLAAVTAAVRSRPFRAMGFGALFAAAAVLLRLQLSVETAGEQAIFAYPAVVVATLLFGAWAGLIAAALCMAALWYFVIPPVHSFDLATPPGIITLTVYLMVGLALIWAVARMRSALARHRRLNAHLEELVERRTSERNRVWERSRELVVILDAQGHVSAANPALTTLMNVEPATLHARKFESMLVDDDVQLYRDMRDEKEGLFEARLIGADRIARVSWSIVREGKASYLVGRDITLEHDCGEMLQQSRKMEFVGQIAGGLAHDFGNLLPPISMSLHLLGRRHAEDRRTRELIGNAEQSVERAGQLIRRLLELSRPSRLEPTSRPLAPILEEVLPLLYQIIGNRDLRLHVEPDLPEVRIDANQLDMALVNLTLNARDATKDNGVLELTARERNGEVEIILADDGDGMDPETLARATEPFFSTKASGEGTGLGLPMVHNFAVAVGGRFTIESKQGAGSRAIISLPWRSGKASPSADHPERVGSAVPKTKSPLPSRRRARA